MMGIGHVAKQVHTKLRRDGRAYEPCLHVMTHKHGVTSEKTVGVFQQ